MSSPIKTTLIGAGNHGKLVLKNLLQLRDFYEVIGIYSDRNTDAYLNINENKIPIFPTNKFGQLGEELVCITTPDPLHFEWIKKSCEHNLFCFVEKPMVTQYDHIKWLMALEWDKTNRIYVGHQFRRSRFSRKIKEIIDRGQLGKIINVNLNFSHSGVFNLPKENWRLSSTLHAEGPLTTLGSHYIDLLHYWFGPIEFVGGILGNYSGIAKDVYDSNLIFGRMSGTLSPTFVLQANYCQPQDKVLLICGTESNLYLKNETMYFHHRMQQPDNQCIEGEKNLLTSSSDLFFEQFSELYYAIRSPRNFEIDFLTASNVVMVLDAILKSNIEKRMILLSDYPEYFRGN